MAQQGNKVIRSICVFTSRPDTWGSEPLIRARRMLESAGYEVQTTRLCTIVQDVQGLLSALDGRVEHLSLGSMSLRDAEQMLESICRAPNITFNVDATRDQIGRRHVDFLFDLIKQAPARTFNFSFVFNSPPSSPFFPAATFARNGVSIGLQPTDLSEGCESLADWLTAMRLCWREIADIFRFEREFLGIDSSIAPFSSGKSSIVDFLRRLGMSFDRSSTTTFYTQISEFIRDENPAPVGLCGLMFPCLEDAELAAEYENGRFTVERNLFLSLHSGLGIDTYPIGVDESRERVIEILQLVQALSNKYRKPLSARFVSDGVSVIGSRTNFDSQYLTDCVVRPL